MERMGMGSLHQYIRTSSNTYANFILVRPCLRFDEVNTDDVKPTAMAMHGYLDLNDAVAVASKR